MKLRTVEISVLQIFTITIFLSIFHLLDVTRVDAVGTATTIQTAARYANTEQNQQHKLKRNLLHWGNHGVLSDSTSGKIEHVTLNPFVLVIGPTARPFNQDEISEIRDVIRTTIIKT